MKRPANHFFYRNLVENFGILTLPITVTFGDITTSGLYGHIAISDCRSASKSLFLIYYHKFAVGNVSLFY